MSATVKSLRQKGIEILTKTEYNNPSLEVELIICYLLDVDRVYVYTHPNRKVDDQIVDKFDKLIGKRKDGYPLQYILGHQEFMGLDFKISEGVLVPRPDTEILIEKIIKSYDHIDKETINIMDIGTGSGAITLSLAYYIKNSYVYSIDISEQAIKVAKKNCDVLNLQDKVEFIHKDILEGFPKIDKKLDVIVSNPPYIPSGDIEGLQVEVAKYEPRLALDGGEDGLIFYKYITTHAHELLAVNGLLAYEIGHNQGEEVKELMEMNGFKDIEVIKDLSNNNRVVIGRRR
ncbi:peptide chain release factor N(5)-glutamine methyltransferase [Clostridium sp. D2Q-11]|uniref:Release factor glutamine methyltransferase n=1 Tax=Anaeromonas frigoriresistens TaxID=2683708 RepID=A0A942Z8T8_9FIRM|nr:peptide chain release factor N(5)-glutamine methyltransferase [Anaeromonas frigoriresistens]MBS4538344.1 peptide chain release factor N(5)-glutamine methyltransferase [Anaeromonas frigoriresistens]